MKISKSSWHYRLVVWAKNIRNENWWEMPGSLCGYFWSVVGALATVVLAGIVSICVIGFIPALLYHYFIKGEQGAGFGLLGITAVFIFILFVFVIDSLKKKFKLMEYEKDASFGRITYDFVIAAKNKVCPFIEYKD